MSTTSLKLPDDLKSRAAAAAQQLGISTHAFMLGAIEQAATATELRARFIEEARTARKAMTETGKGFDGDEVHAHFKARASGKKTDKPKARSWRG